MTTHTGLFLCLITNCCWVLLLTRCSLLTGAAQLPTAYNSALQSELSCNKTQVIRAELMHRHHPKSPLKRGAAAAARIARRLGAGVEFTTRLSSGEYSLSLIEYVMTLYLGTPEKKFILVMDTGSDLVWVQCQPCIRCYGQTGPLFDPSTSNSYSPVPCRKKKLCDSSQFTGGAVCDAQRNCHIADTYGTPGSFVSGTLSTETIAFSNTTEGQLGISNFIFGCMNNDSSTFGESDGYAGFSRGLYSLPSQLSKLTSLNVFSYCLVPIYSSNLTSSLLFGASNSHGLELVYTPLLDIPDVLYYQYYWVNMTGISINKVAVSIPKALLKWNSTSRSGGTIFDSGGSLVTLLPGVFEPVVEAIQDFITYPIVQAPDTGLSSCYNTSGVQQPTYPNITLNFSGVNGSNIVDFTLTGANLFIPRVRADGSIVSCLAIHSVATVANIIGNIAQADHYIEIDLVNKRVGWTSRDCTLPMPM